MDKEIEAKIVNYAKLGLPELKARFNHAFDHDQWTEAAMLGYALEARGGLFSPGYKKVIERQLASANKEARTQAGNLGVRIYDVGETTLTIRLQCKACGEVWTPDGDETIPAAYVCPKGCN